MTHGIWYPIGWLSPNSRGAAALLLDTTPVQAQRPGAGPHDLLAPFWRVGAGFTTKLILNNTRPRPLTVEVQVFDAKGRRIPARRVALAPLASEEVDLGALIGNRRGYGQLALRHDGKMRGLPPIGQHRGASCEM